MKYRFSLFRLLLAVPVFAFPLVLFRHDSPIVAGIIGAAAAGVCLIGKPQEIRATILSIISVLAYFAFVILVGIWLTDRVAFGNLGGLFILALLVFTPYLVAVLIRHYLRDVDEVAE